MLFFWKKIIVGMKWEGLAWIVVIMALEQDPRTLSLGAYSTPILDFLLFMKARVSSETRGS